MTPPRRGAKRPQSSRRTPPCPIVGLGASAGGLEALEAFFSRMPADSGIAFAIVQHRSPDRKSLMPELLAKHTAMPVREVPREAELEANHVYVSPPNATFSVSGRRLRAARPEGAAAPSSLDAPPPSAGAGPRVRIRKAASSLIDRFFHSLAEDQGDNAVCIILSGTGSDGTLGLKAVREYGGTAIAQAAESARWQDMPLSAISAGLVDYVLPVEDMPAWLMEHVQYLRALQSAGPLASAAQETADQLRKICAILRRRTGHDFSRYKQSTLLRRVQRRMLLLHAEGGGRYVERLREDPKEVEELFKDLLIGVTQFFRDKPAFEALARAVTPEMLRQHQGGDALRIWVPGCATGEEAYSIAILLHEQMEKADPRPEVQIFATDIDVQALDLGRQARYPLTIAEPVSPRRLARYFTKHKDSYQLVKEIRDMCTFSVHNLIKDPPFSRLDLVSCRNLLIYLDAELQQKVAPVFHYALRPGGFLFLGPSENLAGHSELFRALDKKARIFQSKKAGSRRVVQFPLVETLRGQRGRVDGAARPRGDQIGEVLGRVITEEYAPPAVAISEGGDVLYFSGRTSQYLEPPAGAPNLNIFSMARKSLRLDLRTAIYKAIKTGQTVVHPNVVAGRGEEVLRLNLVVRPLPELEDDTRRFLVVFQDQVLKPPGRRMKRSRSSDEPLAQELDKELRTTRAHLQTMIEELETSNEQLKLSNDDLLSMNEELQSANEELQTSKEELQSVNEELETVNTELNKKVEELDAAHSDLQNLFKSTLVAAVFLDGERRIRRFTPSATSVLRLIDADIGRPIGDIAMPFAGADLLADIQAVLVTLEPRERQVRIADRDAWYIARILPYRTVNNVIDGAVITFVDITDLKRIEQQRARLAAIVDSSNDAVIGMTLDGEITSWNAGATRLYGYTAADAITRPISIIIPDERGGEAAGLYDQVRRGDSVHAVETIRLHRDGHRLDVSLTLSPIYGDGGTLAGVSATAQDITARKRAEAGLRRSEQVLSDFFENAAIGLHWVGSDGIILRANRAELQLLGYSAEEYVGRHIAEFHVDRPDVEDILARLARGETLSSYEARLRCKDGSIRHVLIDSNVLWEEGRFVHSRCFTRDVTQRKRAETALRFLLQASERLSVSLDQEAVLRTTAALAVPALAEGVFVDLVEHGGLRRAAAEHTDPAMLRGLEELARAYPTLPEAASGPSRVVRSGRAELIAPLAGERLVSGAEAAADHDDQHVAALRRLAVQASLCVPIAASGRVIGALTLVLHDRARSFGTSEIALAEELGRRAGIALENSRLYREAQEASRLRDEFLATLSHELRTPLNAIVGWSEMLRQGILDMATASRAVETIHRNANLQTQLISDILDVSRIIAGRLRLTDGDFDITELVAGVVDSMRPAAAVRQVEVAMLVPDERTLFHGDPARLQQVVGNLLANAVKFVPPGGRVEVTVGASPSMVEISVVDNGPGIRPEYLPFIFERFRQGDPGRGRRSGLGLGLAIVKHLVELHGGTVEAANRPEGGGAAFTVRLPRRGPAIAGTIEQRPESARGLEAPSLRGVRVLLVDDEPDALEVLVVLLQRSGAETIAAGTPAEALELLERERPHVMVSDIQMPVTDGYELMRAVRALPPERGGLTPSIALTAYASSEDRMRALNAGFQVHQPKPVQPPELLRAVGRLAGVLRA